MLSCLQKQEKELVREIRTIEFQRSADSSVFEKYIDNENIKIRRLTADAIAKIGNPIHLPVLHKLLNDKESGVVEKAVFALGQIGGQDSLLLSLLIDERFNQYKKQIITSLGVTRSDYALKSLLSGLGSYPDSLIITALHAITFIAPEKYMNNKLKEYLVHSNLDVSGTAAYFYSRHPHSSAISSLIRANIQPATLWDKYRLKALQRSIKKFYIQMGDSALLDSLKFRITSDLKNKSGSWQHQLYELSILRHFQDSTSYKTIARYLTDPNSHLRLAAINAITRFDTIDARSTLLQVYQDAGWSDKGHIILALAKDNPEMTYNLIQQNLDKGHTYFKQLLLKSLAVIRNNMSIRQLRQFLLVPNIRLKLTAYEELLKHGYIGYRQTKEFLLSGDMALATIAAQSIISHPAWARYDDLSAAYNQYGEPEALETMLALLSAMDLVASNKSIQFIQEVYKNTSSFMISKKTRESLKNANVSIPSKTELPINLFVPESLILEEDTIKATIETNKGNILIEFLPEVAPATVSNFIDLTNKGYYNSLLFHRVVPDFVIQGGDPRGDGWGGPGYSIPCEYNEIPFERGTIGIATSGKDTGGSQLFICHSEQPHLNGRYTVFGKVLNGMDVVDKIEIDDKITQIIIEK
jgi:cyclophilin family peptidyl-prolyl cis-trans isomerase